MGDQVDGFVHRRLKILVPLRHRDFRLLWTGMTVSLLGDGITTIALAWQAYELSDTPTAFSMVGFSMAVPHVILLLVGGAVSDRFERRKVMLAADAIRMVAVTALGLLSVYGHIQIWHMMILAAVYGAGSAFFGPAFDAIVPDLVPENELTQANSLDQFVRPAAFRMLGPAIGGWLIAAFGGRAGDAFLIDGFTFAISISCLILMRSHRRQAAEDDDAQASMVAEIKEGFVYVKTQVWLWGTFLAATLAYLIFWGPAEVLLPYVVKEDMGRSASELGFIFAMGGLGAMFAAVVMGNREMPRRHMTFMYVVWTISTLMVAGYGLATFPWQLMLFAFLFNALESAGLIVWITTKQRLVPGRLLGRVSSFDWFISIGLVPLSYAFTGPVAEALGARTTLVAAGLLGGLVTISFLFLPGMRSIERSGVLAGADLELVSETGLGALESATPPVHEPAHVRPLLVDDEIVGRHQETLARLREALVRWKASRAVLADEIESLEREEHVIEREIEFARSRLVDVRTRLAVLRGLREHYSAAGDQLAEGLGGRAEGAAADRGGLGADEPVELDAG